uniref:Uncharacterized protein n=1 Tax=Paramormyrops kingsleyae TaxID=1676925 RepID=A0A3B3SS01_9TELE
ISSSETWILWINALHRNNYLLLMDRDAKFNKFNMSWPDSSLFRVSLPCSVSSAREPRLNVSLPPLTPCAFHR